MLGVKLVNLVSNTVVRLLGKVESNERFLSVALYQASVPHLPPALYQASAAPRLSPLGPSPSPSPSPSLGRALPLLSFPRAAARLLPPLHA